MADADNTSVSQGGIRVDGQITIGSGDVVGRDKIVVNIQNIQRELSATEAARQARDDERYLLAEGVKAYLTGLLARVEPSPEEAGPYKGLLAYDLSDAEFFFGRKQALDATLLCLRRSLLTVLHSVSGAGKTSLLQAGAAAHAIASGHLPVYLRPRDADPLEFIKRTFIPDLRQTPKLATAPLRQFLHQVTMVLGPDHALILLFDQFEEFLLLRKPEERKLFYQELLDCLTDPSLKVHWVLAVRAEHFSDLAEMEVYYSPFNNAYRLNRLTRDEAGEAIEKSAERYDLTFEAGLVEVILDELLKSEREIAPQLQLVCQKLSEGVSHGATITFDQYRALGGVEGVLRDYLKHELASIPEDERDCADRVFKALVTWQIRRASKSYQELTAELAKRKIDAHLLERVLARLQGRRLIQVQQETAIKAERIYELAHDYLLNEIVLAPGETDLKRVEELLVQGMSNWRQPEKPLIGPDILVIIERQQSALILTDEEVGLLLRSAIAAKLPSNIWRQLLSTTARRHLVETLAAELQRDDGKRHSQAMAVLWALRQDLPQPLLAPVWRWRLAEQTPIWGRRLIVGLLVTLMAVVLVAGCTASTTVSTGVRVVESLETMRAQPGASIVAVSAPDRQHVYVVDQSPGGLYASADSGGQWERLTGSSQLDSAVIRGVGASALEVFAITQDDVVRRDINNPTAWKVVWSRLTNQPQEIRTIAVDRYHPGRVYVGLSPPLMVLESSDSGQSWRTVDTTTIGDTTIQALATNSDWVTLATESGVWVSPGSHEIWRKLSAPALASNKVRALSLVALDDRLFMAVDDDGIYSTYLEQPQDLVKIFNARTLSALTMLMDDGTTYFFAGNAEGLLCWQEWDWYQPEWWRWRLNINSPCWGRQTSQEVSLH